MFYIIYVFSNWKGYLPDDSFLQPKHRAKYWEYLKQIVYVGSTAVYRVIVILYGARDGAVGWGTAVSIPDGVARIFLLK
jgi:hypothetical protein